MLSPTIVFFPCDKSWVAVLLDPGLSNKNKNTINQFLSMLRLKLMSLRTNGKCIDAVSQTSSYLSLVVCQEKNKAG
jgi:hypothetical protein